MKFIVPSRAESLLTGWLATVEYKINQRSYAVRFVVGRTPQCTCAGKPISYYALPNAARVIAEKAADTLLAASKMDRFPVSEESNR